ncbi:MAG: hypothetical protein KKA19_10080 [Candidatus Margulisbacteria bacterium]|nr:hypothetical protein [Candidatus Margulisiibacteriota bacterium]
MAGVLLQEGNLELIGYYRKIGIAEYGLFAGLAFMFPVIIAQFKNFKNKLRYFLLGFMILAFISLILSQFTTAFVIAIMGIFTAMATKKNIRKSIWVFGTILLIVFIIPTSLYAGIIRNFSTLFGGTILQDRLEDLSYTLEEGLWSGTTHTSERNSRIPLSLGNFLRSPFVGTGISYGHQFWFDILSKFGLIGILPWVLIISNNIQNNLRIFDRSYNIYYLISMATFIFFGFVKNMGQKVLYLSIFFIIPGIYFLKYLENDSLSMTNSVADQNTLQDKHAKQTRY